MKNMQNGRSMIEMLGVLAIIGVLSIGGLAGYSKAVERHRINETIYQVNYIAYNTRDLFKSQRTYGALSRRDAIFMSSTSNPNRILADKTKIFPASLSSANYVNLFGGRIYFYSNGRFQSGDSKAFILGLWSIPKSACIEIATRDWPNMGMVAMQIKSSTAPSDSILSEAYEGGCTTQVSKGNALICADDLPVTLPQATTACDTEDNKIYWKFY